jgi:cytidylate kinase
MLSEALFKRLEVPLIKREDVIREAEKYLIRETGYCDISYVDKAPGALERQHYRKKHFLLSFQTALLELVKQGSCIYEGHFGHYLLADVPFVLKVRAVLPLEKRIQIDMEEHKTSYEVAVHNVGLINERRRQWSEFLYNTNPELPEIYDIVVNLDKMLPETAAEMIHTIIQKPEFNSSEDSLRMLEDIYLAAKAKLYIYLFPDTRAIDVDVKADSYTGKIIVRGLDSPMFDKRYEKMIIQALNRLPEINDIVFD